MARKRVTLGRELDEPRLPGKRATVIAGHRHHLEAVVATLRSSSVLPSVLSLLMFASWASLRFFFPCCPCLYLHLQSLLSDEALTLPGIRRKSDYSVFPIDVNGGGAIRIAVLRQRDEPVRL